ncbi:transposase [Prevotella pallens]|mgnify:FL=1|uniref:transposase n=1 Tax=Prevotella pallens TaxID=60133 RepID=UPI0015F07D81|nr:transposase [Prevotella pallens]MBF1452021.1 transposase [Prevotella pallens]MBF1504603.1 transposase [Prevotella pallens]MBF1510131.1 transposase [Prevotella pallens]
MKKKGNFEYFSSLMFDEPFRAVCHYDEETCEEIVFITNNFEISAVEVSVLYRHRWDREVFFKWIKQNIVVKTLWGVFRECSPNPSLGCSHRLSTCCKNKGLQQKPIHHYRSGNADKTFCFGENSPQIFNH